MKKVAGSTSPLTKGKSGRERPAFSVGGHLWVDAIDAHVTIQSAKPSNLWTSSGSCSRHLHTECASCYVGLPDTPQFRGGNPYFFSEHLYQSVSLIYASMYSENVHAIHFTMPFAKKSRHCVIKTDSQQQIGALLHVAHDSRIRSRPLRGYASDWLGQSCSTGDEISRFSEI